MNEDGRAIFDPDALATRISRELPNYIGVPYYLLLVRPTGEELKIDVEEYQWMTTYADWMRGRSIWHLVRKANNTIVFAVDVFDGEQPYYTAKHIGAMGSGGGNEIVAYGIGKKRLDGFVDRLWVLPNGLVCGGDDVETLGRQYLEQLGPRTV